MTRSVYWHTSKGWSKNHIISETKPGETLCGHDWKRQDRVHEGPASSMPATCGICLRAHAALAPAVTTRADVLAALEAYDRAVVTGAPDMVEKGLKLAWAVREHTRSRSTSKAVLVQPGDDLLS